jgi:hypothetical protein
MVRCAFLSSIQVPFPNHQSFSALSLISYSPLPALASSSAHAAALALPTLTAVAKPILRERKLTSQWGKLKHQNMIFATALLSALSAILLLVALIGSMSTERAQLKAINWV